MDRTKLAYIQQIYMYMCYSYNNLHHFHNIVSLEMYMYKSVCFILVTQRVQRPILEVHTCIYHLTELYACVCYIQFAVFASSIHCKFPLLTQWWSAEESVVCRCHAARTSSAHSG